MGESLARGSCWNSSSRTKKLRGDRPLFFERLESRQLLALTHWYTFNSGTGEDLVGDLDVGVINGATVQSGQAVLSNIGVTSGQAATVQYINMPTAALPTGGPLTVVTWFTTNNSANWTRVFDFGNRVGSNGDSYLFFTPQSSLGDSRLVLSTGGGAGGERIASTATTDNGVEHMLAAVVDTATDTLRLYLDGNQAATASLAGADLSSITKSVAYFGRSIYDNDPGFTGSINEIRIYDEALPAATIATDAAAGPDTGIPEPEPPSPLPARQMEDLNRGVIALRRATSQVYVGWRMLGTDPANVSFNLYRSANGGAAVKLNSSPLTQTTDYVDSTANMSVSNSYFVRPIIAGIELAASESFTLATNSPVRQFLNIPLQIPAAGTTPVGEDYTYNANDASVADLDGDGQYEIILKWDPSNSKDSSQNGYTGNTYLDAYELDGELLWRIDLGRNIRSGAHYTQFLVYDLDGDGRAEVAMRTSDGTVDGTGVVMGNSSADYRNSSGRPLGAPEFLTVFNGQTGAVVDSIAFEPEYVSAASWGDGYGNRQGRFQFAPAYLDGERPSIVIGRGYAGPQSGYSARNEVAAFDFRDGELSLRWVFEAATNGAHPGYVGQSAHSISVADLDGDGKDEVITGAAALDDDGTLLHNTGYGHGDALHVSDMIPWREGLEIFMPHEGAASNGNVGFSLRDGVTGELLISDYGNSDIGRGVAADIDPNHPGYEYWANTPSGKVFNSAGEPIYDKGNIFSNFVVWWDADLSRELLDGTTIANWNNPGRSNFDLDPGTGGTQIYAPNGSSNNGSKSTPALSADILGDWREEVIWRRADNTALMIFSTIIPATNRLTTLMHDSQYRSAIAWQNSGYNQPPHPSFFLGTGMSIPAQPNIYLASAYPTIPGDFDLDDDVDNDDLAIWQQTYGTSQLQGYLPGDADGDGHVGGRDFLIWQRNFGQSQTSVVASLSSGAQPQAESQQAESPRDEVFAEIAWFFAADASTDEAQLVFEDDVVLELLAAVQPTANAIAVSSVADLSIAGSDNDDAAHADAVDDELAIVWDTL